MNTGQLAELVAAGFFAAGVSAAGYVMIRLARLISEATRTVADYRDRADLLMERAQSAVDRATDQLARTDSITASMDEVTSNMAELSGNVSAMTGLARAISGGFGAPMLRISALAFGLRRATGLRLGQAAARQGVPAAAPGPAIEQRRPSGARVPFDSRPAPDSRPAIDSRPAFGSRVPSGARLPFGKHGGARR